MATQFNDEWMLDRARTPGGLERAGAVTHFDEQGYPVTATHERAVDRADKAPTALFKHPRWIDRDM